MSKSLLEKFLPATLQRILGTTSADEPPIPHGKDGIRKVGHRTYVGGFWDEIGRLQFEFLLEQGLQPSDVLLDIACGALRGGVHFIRYLDAENYIGIDKEESLLRSGVEEELDAATRQEKRPILLQCDNFNFNLLPKQPRFALAQSLFTHLTPDDIALCLKNLRGFVVQECRFFATFFECDEERQNLARSHDHGLFYYTRQQLDEIARQTGWNMSYIGPWNHPRDQRMLQFDPL
ncbi:MAG: hypothetical protein KDD69_10010 [Bdellovibrionales bacterium]|nr:hypothetical protein [Bdellovibrionales bacterium]